MQIIVLVIVVFVIAALCVHFYYSYTPQGKIKELEKPLEDLDEQEMKLDILIERQERQAKINQQLNQLGKGHEQE